MQDLKKLIALSPKENIELKQESMAVQCWSKYKNQLLLHVLLWLTIILPPPFKKKSKMVCHHSEPIYDGCNRLKKFFEFPNGVQCKEWSWGKTQNDLLVTSPSIAWSQVIADQKTKLSYAVKSSKHALMAISFEFCKNCKKTTSLMIYNMRQFPHWSGFYEFYDEARSLWSFDQISSI